MRKAGLFGKIVLCTAVAMMAGMGQAAAGEPKAPEGASVEKKAELAPQTICPVMGNPINKELYADVDGKRIYVCCKGCIDPIKKNPQKYIKKLEKMGQGVEAIGGAAVDSKDTPAAMSNCPMMNDSSKTKGCFTCPMHPEVMKKEAGKCPTCGMDLVFQKCVMDSSKAKGKGDCCKMKK